MTDRAIVLRIEILNDHPVLTKAYSSKVSGYTGDSGVDVYFPETTRVGAGETSLVGLGIKAEMFERQRVGDEVIEKNVSYFLMPRSSIFKTPLRMANSMGLIDAGYRGELMTPLDNIKNNDYVILGESRLFQIIHPGLVPIDVIEIGKVSESQRGERGFGSSGTGIRGNI